MPFFVKRTGTSNYGGEFETLVICNLILDMVSREKIKSFFLSADDRNFGAFDDIVCEVDNNDGSCKKYALQLKYLNNERKGGFQNALSSRDGHFAVYKYFRSFQENKEYLSDYSLILFTNWKTNMDSGEKLNLNFDFIQVCVKVKVIENGFFGGNCYAFDIDSNIENADIEHFFKNFYILTNQRNVDELRNVIPTQIKKFTFCNDQISKTFLQQIEDWSKLEGKKSKLDKSTVEKILALDSLNTLPISFSKKIVTDVEKCFCDIISQFQVTVFNEKSLEKIQKLWSFTISTDDFKEINKLSREYLISSGNFNELDNTQKSKLLWLLGKCPLIVKENDIASEAIQILANKTIILITDDKNEVSNDSVFKTLFDVKNPKQVQALCQDLTCLIPNEITLSSLIKNNDNLKKCISTDMLLNMLETPYKLPTEKEKFSTIYIDRFLSKILIDIKYLDSVDSKAIIVISGIGNLSNNSCLKKYQTVYINNSLTQSLETLTLYLHDDLCPKSTFEEICAQNRQCTKFHHFKVTTDGQYLEWIGSKSDICELQQYRRNAKLSEAHSLESKGIKIIAGNPGMGKSWFLRQLKNELSLTKFSVLFAAKDMYHICEIAKMEKPMLSFEDFVINQKHSHFNSFEKNILRDLIQTSQVAYLWDALDEINNDQQIEIITDFIKFLSEKNSCHWITCRRHLQTSTEKKFNILASIICEFDEKEQSTYIKDRLKNVYPEEEICEIALIIQNHVGFIRFKDILSIPLQIYMLTELIRNDRKYFELMSSESFSVINVYQYFVDEKIDIFYKDKLKIDESVANLLAQEKSSRLKFYEKTALSLLFEKDILEKFEIVLDEQTSELNDTFGFITNNNNKLTFVHVSYAEYFAACYFAKNQSKLLKDFWFKERYNNVRFFFDLLLAKNSPAHQAVLCRNLDILKKCNEEDVRRVDLGGRNLLQVAASWSERYPLLHFTKKDTKFILQEKYYALEAPKLSLDFLEIVEFLLSKGLDVLSKDQCFGLDALEYAKACDCWFVITLIDKELKTAFVPKQREAFSVLLYSILVGWNKIDNILAKFETIPNIETHQNGTTLLHLALKSGNLVFAQLLLDKGASVDVVDNYGATPLHEAAQSGNEQVAIFLMENKANLNAVDIVGRTPLYWASRAGYIQIPSLLIDNGGDVNAFDKHGCSPLFWASYKGHEEIANLLIEKGANFGANKSGFTPLYAAASNGHEKTTALLIDKGASLNETDKDDRTPLYWASRYGHLNVVKLLVRRGADIDTFDKYGATPLLGALEEGQEEVAEFLVSEGVNVNAADVVGRTPLYWASRGGHKQAVNLLINKGANLEAVDKYGTTPLHAALQKGHEEVVEMLINKGANINAEDKNGSTPLHEALQKGLLRVAKLLIEKGPNINAGDRFGRTPLYWAWRGGYEDIAELLINKGVDLGADRIGRTPLYWASRRGQEKVAALLINKGVDVNAADLEGRTPLLTAAEKGNEKVAELLIGKGANVGAADKMGRTPLYWASRIGNENITRLLVDNGADVNVRNIDNFTPLYVASERGHDKVAEILLDSGANINAADIVGKTPLYWASHGGHVKVTELLICKGADVNASDIIGSTPLWGALKEKHEDIAHLLLTNNANVNATKDSKTPLHAASQSGCEKLASLLISKGANVNAADEDKRTALHWASREGHETLAELLVRNGAKVNATDRDGHRNNRTPLHWASRQNNVKVPEFLISNGANINAMDEYNSTPLHGALQEQLEEVAELLIGKGATVNVANKDGFTPLHVAALRELKKATGFLIENKAKVNAADKMGRTPLYWASRKGHKEIVELLVNNGAKVNAICKDGETPLSVALEENHDTVAEILVDRGAKIRTVNQRRLFAGLSCFGIKR